MENMKEENACRNVRYTLSDLRRTGPWMFRTVPTGKYYTSRNGRRVQETAGIEYAHTKLGDFPKDDWYGLLEAAVQAEGKEALLEEILRHCSRLAWLKTPLQRKEYALDCLAEEAYMHWPEFAEK